MSYTAVTVQTRFMAATGMNDTLDGGLGADTLSGGNDADTFVFSTALGGGNVDTIQFYSVAEDTIQLAVDVFSAIGLGTLAANAFVIGAAATTANIASSTMQ